MGLAAKNAILIVEFAKDHHERKGMGLMAAALRRQAPLPADHDDGICLHSGRGAAGGRERRGRRGARPASVSRCSPACSWLTLGLFFIPMLYVVIQGAAYLVSGNRKQSMATGIPADPHGKEDTTNATQTDLFSV